MGAARLTWAADVDTGSGDTRQIIVALIGALAVVLVALVPVLVNMAKRESTRTTQSPPAPGPGPEETARLWTAIEGVRGEVGEARREHSALAAGVEDNKNDIERVDGRLEKLREQFTRHRYAPGHGHPSNLGPGTDPGT